MTVDTIETAVNLVEEMLADGIGVGSVWEHTNGMSGKKMFAVFASCQYLNINESEFVMKASQIWRDGKWLFPFEHLN